MSIQELDRNYLVDRCEILNAFLNEEIDYETAEENLAVIDFKYEVLTDIESLFVAKPKNKPFDWEKN
jgi:hypothetical protein